MTTIPATRPPLRARQRAGAAVLVALSCSASLGAASAAAPPTPDAPTAGRQTAATAATPAAATAKSSAGAEPGHTASAPADNATWQAAPVTAASAGSPPPPGSAAPPPPAPAVSAAGAAPSAFGELMGVLMPLLLIIAILFAVLHVIRRRFGRSAQGAPLSVVQILPLGPRDRLVVIRARSGRAFTVGVGAQGVNFIADLAQGDLLDPATPHSDTTETPAGPAEESSSK